MTINVKATKPDDNQERQGAARYRFAEPEENSKKPAAIALLLTGLALYLKSAFPGWGQAAAFPHPNIAPEDAKTAPKLVRLPGDNILGLDVDPQTVGTTAEATKPIGSGGRAVDLPGSMSFIYVPSPEIETAHFGGIEVVTPKQYEAPSFGSANDNSGPDPVSGGDPDDDVDRDDDDDGIDPGQDPDDDGSNPSEDADDDDDDDGGNPGEDPNDDDGDPGENPDDDDDDDDEEEEESQNRAPSVSGPVYLNDVFGCMAAIIGLSSLLQNASDPDGDALAISNLTISSGTLTQTVEGWAFHAALLGPVTITYQITDGELSVTQYAYFNVIKSPPIIGTDGNDVLVGTECADDIDGGACDDNIDGRGGNDTLNGGDGNDHIVAGAGNDTVFGGSGHDIIFGLSGNDWLSGGKGNDRLFGGDGDDIVFGDEGNDLLHGDEGQDMLFGGHGHDIANGGDSDDIIHGGDGDDVVAGNAGNDIVFGEAGDDVVSGGNDDDTLSGGEGEDTVLAEAGNDTVIGDTDGGADSYDGGTGIDTLDYSAALCSLEVDLFASTAAGAEIGDDAVADFEVVKTGAGDDTIVGTGIAEELHANAGNDRIEAGGGGDIIADGEGCDTVDAGAGNDTVVAAADGDDDEYDGGDGDDTLDYSAVFDAIIADLGAGTVEGAGTGDDTNTGFETLIAGGGDDTVTDGGDFSSIDTGAGNDTVVAAADGDDDEYDGGDGDDTLDYSAVLDGLIADLGAGTVEGTDTGDDTNTGFETLIAGGGDDTVIDGGDYNSIETGAGNDTIVAAGDGNDDQYDGGDGDDTLDYSASQSAVLVDLQQNTATGLEIGTDVIASFEAIVGGTGDDHFIVTDQAVSLEGNTGNDVFQFEALTGQTAGAQVVHDILDFMVGDRIKISKYEIFKEVMNSLEDRFEDIYGDAVGEDELPIRIRHEQTDQVRQTLIDVDFDRDDTYEMTINITGDHVLMVVDHT